MKYFFINDCQCHIYLSTSSVPHVHTQNSLSFHSLSIQIVFKSTSILYQLDMFFAYLSNQYHGANTIKNHSHEAITIFLRCIN